MGQFLFFFKFHILSFKNQYFFLTFSTLPEWFDGAIFFWSKISFFWSKHQAPTVQNLLLYSNETVDFNVIALEMLREDKL